MDADWTNHDTVFGIYVMNRAFLFYSIHTRVHSICFSRTWRHLENLSRCEVTLCPQRMAVVLALKLHESSVNPRNVNVVESIKVVFIKRIQQSILLQVVEEILELPDDNVYAYPFATYFVVRIPYRTNAYGGALSLLLELQDITWFYMWIDALKMFVL